MTIFGRIIFRLSADAESDDKIRVISGPVPIDSVQARLFYAKRECHYHQKRKEWFYPVAVSIEKKMPDEVCR